jgi:hypothetical protein
VCYSNKAVAERGRKKVEVREARAGLFGKTGAARRVAETGGAEGEEGTEDAETA